MKKRPGQILILVLLVVVVALAIGLSVASRNITNLKTSTQTAESQRAFTAAEGGVEDSLSKLSLIANDISAGTGSRSGCSISTGQASCLVTVGPSGSIQANVNVQAVSAYQQVVEEGSAGQINLDGAYAGGVRTVNFSWALNSNADELSPAASLEITFVCANLTCFTDPAPLGSSYSQHRLAYTINNPSGEQGFTPCPGSGGSFACSVNVVLGNDNVKFVRVKPLWKKTTVKVSSPDPGFPVQTYNLTSSATTDSGITRKVQVSRTSLPQLPAAFDYVLFSEGNIVK